MAGCYYHTHMYEEMRLHYFIHCPLKCFVCDKSFQETEGRILRLDEAGYKTHLDDCLKTVTQVIESFHY